ncbi:hypothetical protein [Thermogemmatispora sp.]|uniref:hypothetical protein n=1 Tax=Thermogemmatispora sp. TaxID=1968838 RepID=UPI0035E4455B
MREQRERSIRPAAEEQEGEEAQEPFDELDRLFIEHLPRLEPPPEVIERILAITRQSAPSGQSGIEDQSHQSQQGKRNGQREREQAWVVERGGMNHDQK